MTGLANRRQADADLQEMTAANAKAQTDFCVMQVDIDRFKTINDALGHAAGDFVLTTASAIFKDCAGPKSRCYRIGGDEFLIVWAGVYTTAQAEAMAERLIRLIKAPMDFKGHRCNVGASIGIALGRDTGFDAMQAAINADLALYQVKRSGRGTYSFFTEDLADLTAQTKALSDRLVQAIDQKKFQPFYQPQFDARTRVLRGVEVLCRWHEPDMGWISPGDFLEVADDLGLVGTIDDILFEKVAEDLETLAARGLSLPKVSFNVTADRLLRSGLAHDLSSRIGMHTTIALELLESMSLDNPPESVRWAIDELAAHGIEIEIDDFGSDRASLAGLMAINPQAMKIDRSIVIPIVESVRHLDLVKKIIDIGAALNVEVVAEGVETEEHALRLASLGCDVLQGYGLARPMPFADLIVHCEAYETGTREASRSIA
ncbi:bifunctional diguanylate cyclase/phosphodiesterase [Yoonia sp. F2084L]|uniref:putative bifunctional diguanylate cyclase/phosphodiesterase n=1 Tax=Yoonia sp. F2084L TaxID=2926419 RepID=UPI001FF3BF1E|nr:bifunctional diguanylate cyclase/phosphodiesterase [Yoonia sp. F2084L]MCK0096707.1 bifunctional diguanylate cyclase/phosphodiesterase [Yoonia sp. F2084L]